MHARRALLYVPGDDRHKIEKALTLGVDCICLDLEDGVAINHRLEARQTIARALQELFFGRSEKLVRINPVGSGVEREDIEATLPFHPDGVIVPKVEERDQLRWAATVLERAELEHSWPVNSVRLLIGVETPRAILNLRDITAHPRLDALIFGGEDYAAALGATRTKGASELSYARQAVLTAAAANGLQAIDLVNIDFKDIEAVREESLAGARMGFTGKQIIHPAQVEPVQSAFTPDAAAIEAAARLMEVFAKHQRAGKGAFEINGKMIDRPLILQAQKVLERAKAAGKL
jgi:citrate lyase beta subunit